MTSKAVMDDFITRKTLAILGVSRNPGKFGNAIYKELKGLGYRLYPIHPEAETLEGDPAYKDFSSLPEKVDGAILVIPPSQTEKAVREAASAGVNRIWMQQGSESSSAIQFCKENGIAEIHGECILMYTSQSGIHNFHRWLWKVFGKAPR